MSPKAQHETVREKVIAGKQGDIRAISGFRLEYELLRQRTEKKFATDVVLLGLIIYEDDRGVRRQTGFCRRLDAVGERWVSAKSPEYEYEY
jgi:hypothetical protein